MVKIQLTGDRSMTIYSSNDLNIITNKDGSLSHLPKKPYTTVDHERYQKKPRIVKCINCNYKTQVDFPNPKCGICHSTLLGVIG